MLGWAILPSGGKETNYTDQPSQLTCSTKLNNSVRETNISAAPSMHVCNRPVSLDCCDITIKIMLGGTFSSPRVYQLSSSQVGTCNTSAHIPYHSNQSRPKRSQARHFQKSALVNFPFVLRIEA